MSRIWRSMSETIQLLTFTRLYVIPSNHCGDCGALGVVGKIRIFVRCRMKNGVSFYPVCLCHWKLQRKWKSCTNVQLKESRIVFHTLFRLVFIDNLLNFYTMLFAFGIGTVFKYSIRQKDVCSCKSRSLFLMRVCGPRLVCYCVEEDNQFPLHSYIWLENVNSCTLII